MKKKKKTKNPAIPQIPAILYTYKTINTNTYHQILNGYLWASSPKKFNDTFDCALNYQIIPRLIDRAIQINKDIDPKAVNDDMRHDVIEEIIEHQRIVSLSDDIYNSTMWSHYADTYSGICIGWNIEKIKHKIHKVVYVKNPYDMLAAHLKDINVPQDSVHYSPFESIARLKLKTWEYESEYRYIDLDINHIENKIPCLIESITFGLKTKDNEKDIIEHLASTGENAKLKIKLYQLRQDNKKLTLSRDLLPTKSS